MISNCAKQFYTDVLWEEVDYMFVDMPPGTGDVPLTVYKELPIKAVVVVTTPQDLVGMIVQKAINMAKKMNLPVIALVENMSYFVCDECAKKHFIYGKGNAIQIAKENGIAGVYQLPLDLQTATLIDQGKVEQTQQLDIQALFAQIVDFCNK
jgi:Mrp family chromosome partitioning ATPase